MSKSKAPTGLKLTRNGNKFTAKWKIAAKDYDDGQGFRWRTHWKKTTNGKTATGVSSWYTESVKKKATKHSFKVDLDNDFYDNMPIFLTSVEFQVRGNESKHKNSKKQTVNNGMSDWASEEFKCSAPPKPTLTFSTGTWPAATCKIKCDVKDTGSHPFEGIEYQSVLLKNSNVTEGSKVDWDSALTPVYDSTTNLKEYTLNITEDSGRLSDGASYTRWVRARAWGASGNSAWGYAKHVYATPNAPEITGWTVTKKGSTDYSCQVQFDVSKSTARPVSTVRVEWLIDTPVMKQPSTNLSSMDTTPPSATWNEGATVKPLDKTSGAVFNISGRCGVDECLWFRAVAVYSDYENPGTAKTAAMGTLDTPSGLSVSEGSDYEFTVSATNNCTIKTSNNLDASVLAVKYYDKNHPNGLNVGIASASPTTVQCPAREAGDTCRIGVFAIVGTYYTANRSDGVTTYKWVYESAGFKSPVLDDGGTIPLPPANVSVNAAPTPGTVTVTWDWTWSEATGSELSWADHDDAWTSTDEPDTYIVNRNMASSWNISGLETGKTWYVRVRLFKTTDGEDTFGGYSDIQTISLAEAPLIPVLDLSDPIITVDGEVTATWGYSTTDGTMQAGAVIAEKNGGVYTKIGEVQTQQTYTISAAEQGWTTGTTHLIAVRVTSASGLESDDWSAPVAVTVADPVTCTISATNLVDAYEYAYTDNAIGGSIISYDIDWETMRGEVGVDGNNQITVTVTSATDGEADAVSITGAATYTPPISDWDDYGLNHIYIGTFDPADADIVEDVTATAVKQLQALPLTATVTGAGDTGTTTLIIERAATYIVDRPDETEFNVYAGETVAMIEGTGSFSVGLKDLIGSLDDTADYNLIATVQDGLGQSASQTIPFTVAWSHQAEAPKTLVEIDRERLAALLTPIAPDNYVSGDTCDIYRLSVDRPQLIRKGATFGEKYVDPYPAIGDNGGYRFVTITKDGDYITQDNHLAWSDVYESIDVRFNIIDFAGGQARLTYNCDISNEWSKDFEQTAYLGGSVVGDWNKAVKRSGTVSATSVEAADGDTVEIMRRLADYPGVCHVRTKDGSSYAADVQVGDKYNYASGVKYTDYSLKISRVETEGYDCITYAEWLELQNEESE